MKKIILAAFCCLFTLASQAREFTYQVYYEDTEHIRGELYQYSERYLGTTDVEVQNGHTYRLLKVQPAFAAKDSLVKPIPATSSKARTHIQMPLPLGEEALMAANLAKKAESVAKQIYRIRETRMNILAGDVEHMPADGKSLEMVLNELKKQERTLTSMFVGKTITQTHTYNVTINIEDTIQSCQMPLLKFSEQQGPLDALNEQGNMVTLNLIRLTRPALAAEQPKRGKPVYEDVIYRSITRITYNNQTIYEKTRNL